MVALMIIGIIVMVIGICLLFSTNNGANFILIGVGLLIFVLSATIGGSHGPASDEVFVTSVTTAGSSVSVNAVSDDGATYQDATCISSPNVDCSALERGDQVVIKRVDGNDKYTVASIQE